MNIIISDDYPIENAPIVENISLYASELNKYLDLKITNDSPFDLCRWWLDNKSNFPSLFKIFLRYSFVPASSSVVEAEFSYTGLVITDKRSRISPDNVNELMVARNNLNL